MMNKLQLNSLIIAEQELKISQLLLNKPNLILKQNFQSSIDASIIKLLSYQQHKQSSIGILFFKNQLKICVFLSVKNMRLLQLQGIKSQTQLKPSDKRLNKDMASFLSRRRKHLIQTTIISTSNSNTKEKNQNHHMIMKKISSKTNLVDMV